MGKNNLLCLLILVFASMGFANFALAQLVPSSTQPGVVSRTLEQDREERSRLQDIIALPPSETGVSGASTEKVFQLNEVIVDNSHVYKNEELVPLYKEFIGQEVSFADLNTIAQRLTVKYREDGYMFSRAVLPPQKIRDGVVHFQTIEGRITDVRIVGDFEDKNGLIAAYANKIKSEGPSNTKDLERYILLIDDLPGITARSVLQPSQVPGGGELIINVQQDDFEGSAKVDNRGSDFLGRYRGELVGAFNSLFGIHDRTTLRGIVSSQTEELRFGEITHEEQLGTEGLRLKGRAAVTRTEPGGDISSLNLLGDSELLELETLYPAIRNRHYNLNLIGGFRYLNSDSELSGIDISKDRLRYVYAGGIFDFTDTLAGVNQFDLQIAQGVDVFGSTEDGLGRSRANGKHDFTRVNLTATRIQRLWGYFSAYGSASGQYSWDPLLASEEFILGGESYGRAYDSGEIVGDQGLAGVIELRYGKPVMNDSLFIRSYQFYGFYDAGKVWNEDPVVGESKNASLASAGAGVRFNLDYDLSGYVEIDKPLTRNVVSEGNDDSRIFFSLLKRF